MSVGSVAYDNRIKEVTAMRQSGQYSSVTMPPNGTGWVAIEKSPKRHSAEEIEAAQHMAVRGYKVTLKDEAGHIVTEDGRLFKATFEQRTPTKGGAKVVVKALEHAKKKGGIQVAVIYDRNGLFRRRDIEAGVRSYENLNAYRFERIIVIGKSGRVHVHKHDT